MPSIEVGTVGGGTFLPAQSTCLDILNVKGASYERPGAHADQVPLLPSPSPSLLSLSLFLILCKIVGESGVRSGVGRRAIPSLCIGSRSPDEEPHVPQSRQGLDNPNASHVGTYPLSLFSLPSVLLLIVHRKQEKRRGKQKRKNKL
jgi:hypothetical protein